MEVKEKSLQEEIMKSKKPNNHKCQNIHFQRVICFSIPVACDENLDLEHLDEVGKEELQIAIGENVDSIYGDDPFPTGPTLEYKPDGLNFFDNWHLYSEDTSRDYTYEKEIHNFKEPCEYVFRGIDGKIQLGELVPPTTKCVLNYYQTAPSTLKGLTKALMREHSFLSGSMQFVKTLWDQGKIDELCEYLVKFDGVDEDPKDLLKENIGSGGTFILCDVKHFQTLFQYQGEEILLV